MSDRKNLRQPQTPEFPSECDSPARYSYGVCYSMGMRKSESNPNACGTMFVGDEEYVQGWYWLLPHGKHFAIAKCDMRCVKDRVCFHPDPASYLAIRLEYGEHLVPGRVMAYLEEDSSPGSMLIKAGTHIAYTGVLYVPDFYERHLMSAYPSLQESPSDILKSIGGGHNWSHEIEDTLLSIKKSKLTGAAAELFYTAKAYELMSALVELKDRRLPEHPDDYERIIRVRRYVDEHYTEHPRLEDLARLGEMSPTKLKQLFKRFTDLTITEYLMEQKANAAAHLLAESELSVQEIATRMGFETAAGFSTSFRKQTGMSPSEYRKRFRAQ